MTARNKARNKDFGIVTSLRSISDTPLEGIRIRSWVSTNSVSFLSVSTNLSTTPEHVISIQPSLTSILHKFSIFEYDRYLLLFALNRSTSVALG